MSYSIYWNKFGSEDFENFTVDCMSDKVMLDSDQYNYWEDYSIDADDEYTEEEKLDMFKESDAYYEFVDSFFPMMNYVHLLQFSAACDQINFLLEHDPVVAIGSITSIEADVICLTGGGMDLSDCIELAYYVIDGNSPVKCSQVMTVNKDLIMFCREVIDKKGFVNFDAIVEFAKEGDSNDTE